LWLEQWIGPNRYKLIPENKLRPGSMLMNEFASITQQFGDLDLDSEIRLPKECGIDDDEDLNIEDRTLQITG
jgi:hypothetical protein